MPRRRPGALRARQRGPRVWGEPPAGRIPGLSARTSLAIHRLECGTPSHDVFPGATDRALRAYRAFLRPPGRRVLYPPDAREAYFHGSYDDVRYARDVLEDVLRQLPARPRGELRRRVASLDAVYRGRTLPDPFADRAGWPAEFWWRRLSR